MVSVDDSKDYVEEELEYEPRQSGFDSVAALATLNLLLGRFFVDRIKIALKEKGTGTI